MNEFKIDTLHCCLNQRWNNSFGITGEVNVPIIKVSCFQQYWDPPSCYKSERYN